MEISGDVFNNISIDKKEVQFFNYIYDVAKENKSYMSITPSFEEYYFILKETMAFYEKLEMYEKCIILKNHLDTYLKLIPNNVNEALDYLVKLTPDKLKNIENILEIDDFSIAIDLHHSVGRTIIDWWLLRLPISPMVEYYEKQYDIKNEDKICHDILLKYVKIVKSKISNN
jgi:hypothetical protein